MQSSRLYSSICASSAGSPRLHPLLEDEDRRAAVLHLRPALEVEERLQLLEPVAGTRGADAVADDAEQVDEDLAPQQVVDLVLARAVAAHQPLERGDLVLRVVVDVHVGVLAQARVHEVDELLERGALLVAVAACSGVNARSASRIPQRYSSPPVASQNGLPSKSKKRSPADGSGSSAKPAPGSGRDQLVAVARRSRGPRAGARPAGAASRRSPARARGGGSSGARPRAASVAMSGGEQLLDLRAPHAGDPREVVDRVPVRVAERLEVADAAVVVRPRLGGRRGGDEPLEPRAHAAVVGAELLGPERDALAGAEHDVDLPRRAPGDPRRAARCRSRAGGCSSASRAARAWCRPPRRSRRAAARRSRRARASGRCGARPGRRRRRRRGSPARSRRRRRPSRRPRARSRARRARRRGARRGRPPRARLPCAGSARPADRARRVSRRVGELERDQVLAREEVRQVRRGEGQLAVDELHL